MIEIQTASKTDVPLIQQLAYTIWNVAYKDILSKEQLAYMLDKMHSIEALTKLIDDGHQFIISYEYGVAKGYACYKMHPGKARVEKLYVLPDQHKKGIGKLLMNHIIEKVSPHVNIIELNVNRQNKAVDFYKRIGFEIVKEVDQPIGEGYFMNDYVMQKRISEP
ncbi:MAG: family N-acetyltransferase [Chitinophagaceae bacterium]|nr:family N-acetyltransferase [Chitinophagaceae bacterium]